MENIQFENLNNLENLENLENNNQRPQSQFSENLNEEIGSFS
jgi:hypothetical protein